MGLGCPLLPLRMMAGPIRHFYSAILEACHLRVTAQLADRGRVSRVWILLMLRALQLLNSSPPAGNEIKCCSEPFCVGECGTDSFLARPRRKRFLVYFVVVGMEMGICFGSVPFSPLPPSPLSLSPSFKFENSLKFCLSWLWIVGNGPVVFCGMAGCLGSVLLVKGSLGCFC